MQLIALDTAASAGAPRGDDAGQGALAGVIASIGDSSFGHTALAQLNSWMPLCWWSVYRLHGSAPPTIHAAGTYGVPDGTAASWRAYRAGLYRRDETFAAAWDRVRRGETVMTHWNAREIAPPHREAIYSRNGLRERVSLVSGDEQQGMLAVNLYRHMEQKPFSDDAIDAIRRLARPMLACVAKHVALARREAAADALDSAAFEGLTVREREVCARLLKGWTHEGIAADLQLSAATIKTYRDRAFRRLGIHHRNELFALAMVGFLP